MTIPVRARRALPPDEIVGRSGIDEAMIARLVEAFYGRVRADPDLGPIFNARIHDWDAHLATMKRFWSSVALTSGAYRGDPMAKHAPLPVGGEHFDRWLVLFREAAEAVCAPEAAAYFIERADRIAHSLEMGIAVSRGALLLSGERLDCPVAP